MWCAVDNHYYMCLMCKMIFWDLIGYWQSFNCLWNCPKFKILTKVIRKYTHNYGKGIRSAYVKLIRDRCICHVHFVDGKLWYDLLGIYIWKMRGAVAVRNKERERGREREMHTRSVSPMSKVVGITMSGGRWGVGNYWLTEYFETNGSG